MATETRVGLYLLRGWINKFSWNSQHQIQLINLSVTELLHTYTDTQCYLKRTVANFRCKRAKKAMIYQGATVINFANEFCFQFHYYPQHSHCLYAIVLSPVFIVRPCDIPYLPWNATDHLQCFFSCICNLFINLSHF